MPGRWGRVALMPGPRVRCPACRRSWLWEPGVTLRCMFECRYEPAIPPTGDSRREDAVAAWNAHRAAARPTPSTPAPAEEDAA